MEADIKEALSRSVCGGWDRGFLESILEQIAKGRKLSEKQITTVTKVLLRNGEQAQVAHNEWESVYRKKYNEQATWLAKYYQHTGYFRELSRISVGQGARESNAWRPARCRAFCDIR